MLLWPGAATSPSAVSKFCGILGNGQVRPRFRILILWFSSVADSLEMIEMSSRYHFNNFALFSNYKPMLQKRRKKKKRTTEPHPYRISFVDCTGNTRDGLGTN